jgi:hypothetical protein
MNRHVKNEESLRGLSMANPPKVREKKQHKIYDFLCEEELCGDLLLLPVHIQQVGDARVSLHAQHTVNRRSHESILLTSQ